MVNNLDLIAAIDIFSTAAIIKNSFIRKLPNGKYRVVSRKGKNLGTYKTKEEASARLRAIEFFKHKKASDNTIDLSDLEDLSYSAIMRVLRKNADYEIISSFLSIYKQIFDSLVKNEMDNPADKTLPITLMIFGQLYSVKLPK